MLHSTRPLIALATVAALLALGPTAEAQVANLPLPAPPTGQNQASGSIFDAMLAIARAAASNPSAAQRATYSYNQAVQQYQAGQLSQARSSALQAIVQTAAPPLPPPIAPPPTIPTPTVARMPLLNNPPQADAEEFVALIAGSLDQCGPTTGSAYQSALRTYQQAQRDYVAGKYNAVRTEAKGAIDGCAAELAQLTKAAAQATSTPLPPVQMPPLTPDTIVTPGPDPALEQPAR